MSTTLAITGLRPQKMTFGFNEADPECFALKEKIREILIYLIENDKIERIISGFAQGVDQYTAEIVIELKKLYKDIKLEAAIPCRNQERLWPPASRKRYNELLKKCDDIHYCSQMAFRPELMIARNE